jgi:hypothetical protein
MSAQNLQNLRKLVALARTELEKSRTIQNPALRDNHVKIVILTLEDADRLFNDVILIEEGVEKIHQAGTIPEKI